MSHFTVLVIGNDPEQQLLPFDENLRTEFKDMTDEYRDQYENKKTEAVIFSDGRKYSKHSKEMKPHWKRNSEFGISSKDEFIVPEGAELKEIPFKELYDSFEKFAEDYLGEKPFEDEGGAYGYLHNPKAKWDWYQLGGRWKNYLPLKNGTMADEALWGDIDVDKLEATFAVLKNDCWYERGEMGWWAMVSNDKDEDVWEKEFRKLIKNIAPDTPVAIYDCHI